MSRIDGNKEAASSIQLPLRAALAMARRFSMKRTAEEYTPQPKQGMNIHLINKKPRLTAR
jgi:hypothetical protein